VERDEKKAKEWFRAATLTSVFKIYPPAIEQLSKMGEWSADLVAGHCYFSRKSEKCVYWLKRSASKGSVDAMFLLALYYSEVQKLTNHYEAYAWMQLVLSTKDNKKPVIDSISSTIDSNYIELAIFCRDKAMPDILKDYFSKDLVDKYIKDPNLITNIAQAVCEIWKQEVIGEEGALKAQERTQEIKNELLSLSEQSPKAPL
jgi:TPR repeat protein